MNDIKIRTLIDTIRTRLAHRLPKHGRRDGYAEARKEKPLRRRDRRNASLAGSRGMHREYLLVLE
jgi:hypothetical protein